MQDQVMDENAMWCPEISLRVPSLAGMIDMRIDLTRITLSHVSAYRVALYGPGVLNDEQRAEKWHFLNPEDPHYPYFIYRVTQLKSRMQAQIPGCPCLLKDCPRSILTILGLADTTALILSLAGPEKEGLVLACLKEHDTVNFHSKYCQFLEPQSVFHVYYQERLGEYRMQTKVPLRIPRFPSALNTPRAGAVAVAGKPYGPTQWNGYTSLDEGFRAELEANLRAKWEPSPLERFSSLSVS